MICRRCPRARQGNIGPQRNITGCFRRRMLTASGDALDQSCDAGGPVEADYGGRMQLLESCGRVARQTSPKVTPGQPGELRSCPKGTLKLSNNCRGAEIWASLANIGQKTENVDQSQPMLARCWTTLGSAFPRFTKIWPMSGPCWKMSTTLRQGWPHFGLRWGHAFPKLPQIG